MNTDLLLHDEELLTRVLEPGKRSETRLVRPIPVLEDDSNRVLDERRTTEGKPGDDKWLLRSLCVRTSSTRRRP